MSYLIHFRERLRPGRRHVVSGVVGASCCCHRRRMFEDEGFIRLDEDEEDAPSEESKLTG